MRRALAFGRPLCLAAPLLSLGRRWVTPKPRKPSATQPWTDRDPLKDTTDRDDEQFQADTRMSLDQSTQDMSTDDVAIRLHAMQANYDPALYAFTFFESVDIYRELAANSLVPQVRPDIKAARWFVSPVDIIRTPSILVKAMGQERWDRASVVLREMLADYDGEASPIVIALQRYELPPAEWLPVLRWMVSEGCESDFRTVLPSFAVALANGQGPSSLSLPSDHTERTAVVGNLLLAAAKEYGRVQLASFAVELIRSTGREMTFVDQKNLMCVFSRSSRRSLDWQLRASGSIQQSIPRWLKDYFRKLPAARGSATYRTVPSDEEDDSEEDEEPQEEEAFEPLGDTEDAPSVVKFFSESNRQTAFGEKTKSIFGGQHSKRKR